jgi:tetratricopeptide (TPR) repeat protein
MTNNLEQIMKISSTGNSQSEDLIRSFELISHGDKLQLREPGWLLAPIVPFAWAGKKALFKGDKTYDSAEKLLTEIASETSPGGAPTDAANIASLQIAFIKYDRDIKKGDLLSVNGKRGLAVSAYENAVIYALDMMNIVDINFNENKALKGYIHDKLATAYSKTGDYTTAKDLLDIEELATNKVAANKRGDLATLLGNYQQAVDEYNLVFDKSSRKEDLGQISTKLAETYERLSDIVDTVTRNTAGIDANIVASWNEAYNLLGRSGIREQREKIMEVIDGIPTPETDQEKSMVARAYHGLAVLDRRERNPTRAIDNLRTSIGIVPTPEAYQNLAETHKYIAANSKVLAR